MPWQGVSPVDLRMLFITEYLTKLYSVTELAIAYGVSGKTAHDWIRHYKREGSDRLVGASRRPRTMPRATAGGIVDQLLAARRHHPTWGAGKLRDWLVRRDPMTAWPCRDTIHTILSRHGTVRRRRHAARHVAPPHHLTVPTRPNLVWTVDFKGQFCTGDGALCYPFTLRDGYSRYILRCTALRGIRTAETQRELARAFATYGLPDRIRSDNGPPFGASTLAGLSRLAVWWLRLGILPEHSRPGCPGDNGSHEQFHAVLKRETTRPPAVNRRAQQRRFTRFVTEYNHERPHDAVNHAPPATRYDASDRRLPARLPSVEYAPHADVRHVTQCGHVKWNGRSLYLSRVLADQHVALEPTDDGVWLIRFGALPLAIFHERTWRLHTPDLSPPPKAPRM